jgi:hypothetical protein
MSVKSPPRPYSKHDDNPFTVRSCVLMSTREVEYNTENRALRLRRGHA